MIYNIYIRNEDAEYKDICLDAALTDYAGETWSATISLDKNEMVVLDTLWRFSPHGACAFKEVERSEVPRWFRAMHDKMKPRIIEEHFQALIDAWKAKQEEEEPANNLG